MVFSYKRKTNRGNSWTEHDLEQALGAINEGRLSIRAASRSYNIPYTTLIDHKKSGSTKKRLGRFSNVFSEQQEADFVNYLKELDLRFYGLTKRDFCRVAFEYAEKNKIKHPFRNEQAGHQWFRNFMNRNPQLSLRAPEPTSVARACGFNKAQVETFFKNLKQVNEKYNISLDNTYNVDETGIHTSGKRPPKVLSSKGKKQVGAITSSERGTLVTSLFCCSATGKFIPPTLVFPRKKKNPRYLQGTPPGTLMLVSDNGWITAETFLEWLKFFVASVRPTQEHKCLLILDNHVSHRSIEVLEYASENNVVILSVPPHTTHKIQPLDVAVYGPFSRYFERELDKWQKEHPAQRVTFYDIGAIFGQAYLNSAIPNNAIKGFSKTGISTCDMTVFSELDFMPSDVTDSMLEEKGSPEEHPPSHNPLENTHDAVAGPSNVPPENLVQASEGLNMVPTSSVRAAEAEKINETTPPSQKKEKIVLISDIRIIPKVDIKKSKAVKRKAQKSEILTATPVKRELREKQNKTTKNLKKCVKASSSSSLLQKKKNGKENKQPWIPKHEKENIKRPFIPKPPIVIENPEDDVPCIICEDSFSNSRPGENWIQCNICQNWAHELCTDYKSGVFICDKCRGDILSKRR